MADFLAQMADVSRRRVGAARAAVPERELRRRADDAPPTRGVMVDRFLLIAEIKLASPSKGPLAGAEQATDSAIIERARRYAAGGAGMISVLTEPVRFGGRLEHLGLVAAAVPIPVLRKDFLVDPYQLVEARAAGASAVLLIARMVEDARLRDLLGTAKALGLAVLIEAFDEPDLARIAAFRESMGNGARGRILVGLNTRSLADLSVDSSRLGRLVGRFPPGVVRIAESGFGNPDDVSGAAALGYDGALVGTALMRSSEPEALCRRMLDAARQAVADPPGASRCA